MAQDGGTSAPGGGSGGNIVVLVVEDDPLVRMLAADHLRDYGFVVVPAENAAEALEVLSSATPIHFVFTDVVMPGAMDGLALADWLRANRPRMPFAVASGNVTAEEAQRRLGPGEAFFMKPYEFDLLAAHIARSVWTMPTPQSPR
jgi:CheY-like chemotaxis protein